MSDESSVNQILDDKDSQSAHDQTGFTYTGIGNVVYTRPYREIRHNEYKSTAALSAKLNFTELGISSSMETTPIPYVGQKYIDEYSEGYQTISGTIMLSSDGTGEFLDHSEAFMGINPLTDTGFDRTSELYGSDIMESYLIKNDLTNNGFSPLDSNIFDMFITSKNQSNMQIGHMVFGCKLQQMRAMMTIENELMFQFQFSAFYQKYGVPESLVKTYIQSPRWNAIRSTMLAFANGHKIKGNNRTAIDPLELI